MSTIFFDIEASGLHAKSYPIEIAWVKHDLAKGWSTIIRPVPEWTEADWSGLSEKVHGLSYRQVHRHGLDVRVVAERLNADLAGANIYSDAPKFDGKWLAQLYRAAGIEPAFGLDDDALHLAIRLESVKMLEVDSLIASIARSAGLSANQVEDLTMRFSSEVGIIPHRAMDDAIYHALSLAAVAAIQKMNDSGNAVDFKKELVNRARTLLQAHGRLK